ncbi:allatostatin-A receptor-like [Amphiura filiformis]|uniref:allatostatin-A receptor-like n=1 Tax=Amphiura filiformis TaxID=82378 RepID=UPI003B217EA4
MEPVLYLRIVKTTIGLFGMLGNTLLCLLIVTSDLVFQGVHHIKAFPLVLEYRHVPDVPVFFPRILSVHFDVEARLGYHIQELDGRGRLRTTIVTDSGKPFLSILGFRRIFALLVASTFSLVVLTLERYMAIIFPFHYITLFTRKKTVIFVCCIWVLAFAYALTDSMRFYMEDNACMTRKIQWIIGKGIISFCVQYCMPISVMLFAYGHNNIMFVLSKKQSGIDTPLDQRSSNARNINRSTNTHPETLQESLKRARRNVLKTLLLVFVAFVVCWTPNQFFFLFYNLGFNLTLGSPANTVTVIMAQSNSAVNFFVYGFKYKQFRRGIRKLFRCPMSIEHLN